MASPTVQIAAPTAVSGPTERLDLGDVQRLAARLDEPGPCPVTALARYTARGA
jgi:hypothetical protein